MASQKNHKLLILEDAVILSMAMNPTFVKAFPFLAPLKKLSKAAKSCCNGKSTGLKPAINNIKGALRGMGNAQKIKLKELLHTDKLRIKYREGNRIMEVTF